MCVCDENEHPSSIRLRVSYIEMQHVVFFVHYSMVDEVIPLFYPILQTEETENDYTKVERDVNGGSGIDLRDEMRHISVNVMCQKAYSISMRHANKT